MLIRVFEWVASRIPEVQLKQLKLSISILELPRSVPKSRMCIPRFCSALTTRAKIRMMEPVKLISQPSSAGFPRGLVSVQSVSQVFLFMQVPGTRAWGDEGEDDG